MGFLSKLNPFSSSKPTIVIVCKANITRSPYFAELLRTLIGEKPIPLIDDLRVTSAGVDAFPGIAPNPIVGMIATTHNMSLKNHRSRRFNKAVANEASLVLTMEENQRDTILKKFPHLEGKVFALLEFGRKPGERDSYDVPDPTGRDVEEFREFVETAHSEAERLHHHLKIHGLPKGGKAPKMDVPDDYQ